MVCSKKKYEKLKNKIYACPKCGSHRVYQKHDTGDFKFLCLACYWHGQEPIIRDRVSHGQANAPVCEYVGIIRNLLNGKTIAEQFTSFGVPLGAVVSTRGMAVRNKILRVYAAFAEVSGNPCEDPDFTKIRVTQDVLELLKSAIQEEEDRIRSSPRQSITFSK